MTDIKKIIEKAVSGDKTADSGFDKAFELNMDSLVFRDEVRDMCAADRCRSYGKNWCCPPACGTIADARAMIARYHSGVLVETVGELEDEFDIDGMNEAGAAHKRRFYAFADEIRAQYPDALAMSAGTCTLCEKCSCPDAPCRHPDRRIPSMEAYGLWVSDVCEKSGAPYYNGKNTVTYISCILFI